MSDVRGVPWREAWRTVAYCWAVSAVVVAFLSFFEDSDGLPVAAPVVILLARWFWERHRYRAAGAAAAIAGCAGVGVLIDLTRPHLGRMPADALSTAVGATLAIAVFTAVSRLTAPLAESGT